MPRTEREKNRAPSQKAEAALDDALDDSFPASDPLASTPRRAGRHDKKAPVISADRAQDLRETMDRLKERPKH